MFDQIEKDEREYAMRAWVRSVQEEVTDDRPAIRKQFLNLFADQVKTFTEEMGRASFLWSELERDFREHEDQTKVVALVLIAISLHNGSMKQFLLGNFIASGNLFRQATESVALALLCSKPETGILKRFDDDQYSTSSAVTHLERKENRKAIGIEEAETSHLMELKKFYDKMSHPSKMTLDAAESFHGPGIYMGSSFDEGKKREYTSEVNQRVQFAKSFGGFIGLIRHNISTWAKA